MANEAPWERLVELVENQPKPKRREDHERPKLAWTLAAIVGKAAEGVTLPLALDHCRVPRIRGVVWSDLGLHGVPLFTHWIRDVHQAYAKWLQECVAVQTARRRRDPAAERAYFKAMGLVEERAHSVPEWMDRDRIRGYTQGQLDALSAQPITRKGVVVGHAATLPSARHEREARNLLERDIRPEDYLYELRQQRAMAESVDDGERQLRVV
jgi:hypothetical protein